MSDGIDLLQRIIQQAAERHKVLASNIANVDTPNYRAKDIKFDQVLGKELGLAATDPKHITTAPAAGAPGPVSAEDSQPWADQNNVELDLEVAKMTENGMFYEAGVTLLAKKIQMFKNAIKTIG